MKNKCPVCGKKFFVLYPHLWTYKRDGKYICSYGCMRTYDKGEISMSRTIVSEEQKKRAIEIALEGGDYKGYLEECGSKNPSAHWYLIKKQLMKNDPETYEKLAKMTGSVLPQVETPEGEFAPAKIGGLCPPPGEVKKLTTATVMTEAEVQFLERTTVTAIRVEGLGEFYYNRKYNCIDWRTVAGEEVSLGPAWWIQLTEDLPMVMKKLGVEL